jgi:flagellar biosynthesis protein FliP
MEALGSLAVFISFAAVFVSIALVIAFFIMTSNISDIAKKVHVSVYNQNEIKTKLDRIIRLMEQEAKERLNERTSA